jgi:hypothetical protein
MNIWNGNSGNKTKKFFEVKNTMNGCHYPDPPFPTAPFPSTFFDPVLPARLAAKFFQARAGAS